jgi:hypothetical protein
MSQEQRRRQRDERARAILGPLAARMVEHAFRHPWKPLPDEVRERIVQRNRPFSDMWDDAKAWIDAQGPLFPREHQAEADIAGFPLRLTFTFCPQLRGGMLHFSLAHREGEGLPEWLVSLAVDCFFPDTPGVVEIPATLPGRVMGGTVRQFALFGNPALADLLNRDSFPP